MINYIKYNLVNDLGFVKTGVDNYSNIKKYFSTGSIKKNIFTPEGSYSYKSRPSRANREVFEGDVLQARMQNTNKILLVDKNLHGNLFSTGFFQFRPPKELVIPKYLYYFLSSNLFLKRKDELCGGSTQKAINDKNLEKIDIYLPPLEEQKRIVAKLDAAFAEIDGAVAATTKNIETVEFLFQKSLDKIFCNPSLKFIELDEACSIIGGGTPSKKNKSFFVGKVPWATVRDMKNDYISNTEFKITNDAIKKSSTNVIPSGNVVIATRVGLGKICIVKEDTAINQDLKGIIPKNTELLDRDFLFFWFKSISKKIINAGTGATVQGVKLPFIKSLKIPDIDITSQKKLASNAKFISEQSELLARIYNKKLNELAVLKATILKQELQPSEAA